jgi:uncharacterized membrane protein
MFIETKKTYFLLLLTFSLVPVIYLLVVWNTIPAQIPLHFNSSFEVDSFGPKNNLLIRAIVISVVAFACCIIVLYNNKFDPKVVATNDRFRKIAMITTLFLTALNFILINSSLSTDKIARSEIILLIGIFITTLGNYLPNIKPNYFVGFKLPWTLEDPVNWKKTHAFAGKLWFFSGFLIVIIWILVKNSLLIKLFLVVILIITILPIVYSFYLFKKIKR